MIGHSQFKKFVSDSSEEYPALLVYQDPQGDIYVTVRDSEEYESKTVRICGYGGGSRYEGLANKLSEAFFGKDEAVYL